ncbi:MAG: molecular chaperone HtpG [Alphaproteobacteria bacterium]
MSEDTLQFQAEVGRILHLMVHSVYSNKEIFLRELISNASDACDRLRYAALARPELTADDGAFRIAVSVDRAAGTITVADNGIGMNRQELIENLGTIARSGTGAFLEQLSGDARKDVALIGQFGVGFYAAFMVADRVEVTSRKAGEDEAWAWHSDGQGSFTVAPAGDHPRGTRIVLHVRADAKEFLDTARLRGIVQTYSDHIAVPILLSDGANGEGETVNAASALWTRARSEISEEQYTEFYHHVAHAFDQPWMTLHWRAEGRIEYTGLLFVPSARPFDLFRPERRPGVKLYVKRVFITDECEAVVPGWLRFLRGVVDSEDLPLNISREMLQHNPVLTQIRAALVRRVLGDLEKRAESDPDGYLAFWDTFGQVLKEGLYEEPAHRDALLKLARFRSTRDGGWTTLADYVARMRPGQDAIHYISGAETDALRRSPHLEGFAAKGVEVLLLPDAIDDFWVPTVGTFDGKPFRSVTRGGADLEKIAAPDSETPAEPSQAADLGPLLAGFRVALGDAVKDVRASDRLTESPVCLVADEGGLDIHMERMLKLHGQQVPATPRILELNPRHALIRRLAEEAAAADGGARTADMAHLLLDQARIVEGEPLPDPAAFSRRLSAMLAG